MSNIKLVAARAGLTNYYHNPVIRNQAINIDSTIVDQLSSENHMGGIGASTLINAAVHSGGLNVQAAGFANIAGGGWNESKGLMMLDFTTQDSPVMVEYMHVIGYVTNNASLEGLTMDAMFHPVMSWKSQETITSSLSIANPTSVKRNLGARTDYLFNDGSSPDQLIALRPSDVIDYSLERATRDDMVDRMQEEGLDNFQPSTTVASSDISRVGIVTSKRQNLNPIMYAGDILKAGTNYQRSNMLSNNMMNIGGEDSQWDGMFGELSNLAYQAQNNEPQLLRDDFFREMMQVMGISQMRGFTGYSIRDLVMTFDNLNDVLDLTFMSQTEFQVEDYTQNTEAFGTSAMAEVVAAEIEANILDLMLKRGLNGISFRGSNCDNFGDGGLDNIVILPYNPASLEDDDYTLGHKVDLFINDLTSQIFTKLNGLRSQDLVPIRFEVTAELFGTTVLSIQLVNDANVGGGFLLEDTGSQVGMVTRSFPTFAINARSSILGNSESAQLAGSNFFSNIEAYFQ